MNTTPAMYLNMKSKSTEKAHTAINNRIHALSDLNVCLLCDGFVSPDDAVYVSVDRLLDSSFRQYIQCDRRVEEEFEGELRFEPLPVEVSEYYTYTGNEYGRPLTEDEVTCVKSLLLSPRGTYRKGSTQRETGFLICESCHYGVKNARMPKYAIANNFYFGAPPQCLLELNDVELALLTPMRTYGYVFSFTGGKHEKLKGSLVYYKIDVKKVKESIILLKAAALDENVVVLLHGTLTSEQAKRAYARSIVRPDKLETAVKWLIANNAEWQTETFESIKQRVANRTLTAQVIERFTETKNSTKPEERDVEDKDSFDVFYPDGTSLNTHGDVPSIERFHALIQRAKDDGYALALRKNQSIGERASEFNTNNLVNSCLLQFPYGLGGMRAKRYKGDLSTGIMNVHEYAKHLSNISQPQFHSNIFCLVLYNLFVKHQMLLTASYSIRGNVSAEALMQNITAADVAKAVEHRKRGDKNVGTPAALQYLTTIDSISRNVAHSPEAAKRARGIAEAHMHHFGLPTFFLTACPDDDNSIVIQVMAQEQIDDDTDVATLADATVETRAKQRTALRLKFPGICALYFAEALDIILLVVGWNMKKKSKTSQNGIFGETIAIAGSVEEQGRGTLHVHLQVWVKEFINAANNLHSFEAEIANTSKQFIERIMDNLAQAKLFDPDLCPTDRGDYGIFDHKCENKEVHPVLRKPPVVQPKQQLRNLRHLKGQIATNKLFAMCPYCSFSYTSLQLTERFVISAFRRYVLSAFPDSVQRLKAVLMQFQKGNISDSDELKLVPYIVNAVYNHHIHTKSCFSCKAKKLLEDASKKRSRNKRDMRREECRYRFPTCPSKYTRIRNLSDTEIKWFFWDGTYEKRQVKELVMRRHDYDVFQNSCCRAISHSMLSCNSNLQFVTPGPIVNYCFLYCFKSTQDDDNDKFDAVVNAVQRKLNGVRASEPIRNTEYASARSVAIQMILSGSFAHERENVVSPTMAAFLLRTGTRFLFSHDVVWCPLHDLEMVMQGNKSFTTLRHVNHAPFYNNAAMHYLCRPRELDAESVFSFYSKFEVIANTNQRNSTQRRLELVNSVHFQHPSFQEDTQTMLQCVVERSTPQLIRVQQYAFPDTASFHGDIMDSSKEITDDMEQYAKLVLLLFLPFRSILNLLQCGSYTTTFRMFATTALFTQEAKQYLQNIQDCRANCFRLSDVEDELQQSTECYHDDIGATAAPDLDTGDVSEDNDLDTTPDILDSMLEQFASLETINGIADSTSDSSPPVFDVSVLRERGKNKCGFDNLAPMELPIDQTSVWESAPTDFVPETIDEPPVDMPYSLSNPQKHELATLLLLRVNHKQRTFANISRRMATVNVLEANGSARSIVDWGRKANLDKCQQRAFEVLIATFILTFYTNDDAHGLHSAPPILREEFERLQKLSDSESRGTQQLICLVHGPGGSGKSTVIDLLLTYAREFSGYLDKYNFDEEYSIVVTAMSGVAATLILGETTHGALHLNRTAAFTQEHYERWQYTRMVIIDEISLASKKVIEKIESNLRKLLRMNRFLRGSKYGGMNIVFCGDFRQLEPVKCILGPLYKTKCYQFEDWINCYIELDGKHRFADDPDFGNFCTMMREGTATKEDIDWLNTRVVNADGITQDGDGIPHDVRYCTYGNRDRDAISAALFLKRCNLQYNRDGRADDSLIIFCDNLQAKNGTKVYQPFPNHAYFHRNVGEADCEVSSFGVGRFDPVLKLYRGCPVMLPFNASVSKGLANGTQSTVQRVLLRPGVVPTPHLLGGRIPVNTVIASDVLAVQCRHVNDRVDTPTFSIAPRSTTFSAKMIDPNCPEEGKRTRFSMKGTQVPLISNSATTGHKLQGSSLDSLFVSSWETGVQNWAYVVVSRVRTKAGLFLRSPLPNDPARYAVPAEYTTFITSMKTRKPDPISEETYASFDIVSTAFDNALLLR